MGKQEFHLCENKGADPLSSNCEADQHLCFRYTDSTISLFLKSEISSFSVTAQVCLCQTCVNTPAGWSSQDWFSLVGSHFMVRAVLQL